MNKLERFRRLSVSDDWPQCFLCNEPSSSGLTLWSDDGPTITVCDGCIKEAKSSKTGWLEEFSFRQEEKTGVR